MLGYIRQRVLLGIATLASNVITYRTWLKFLTRITMFNRIKRVVFKEPESSSDTDSETDTNLCDIAAFAPFVDGKVQIHPDTNHPTRAWEKLKAKQTAENVKHLSHNTPISSKKVRFVCISDTHNKTKGWNLTEIIPDGDILIHAGDFSMVGHPSQIEEFNNFLGQLPHKHKVVIAGNHDLSFDTDFLKEGGQLRRFGMWPDDIDDYMTSKNITRMADVLTNCTAYLEDTETTIYGIRIYGSPWQPWFGDWGFNLRRGAPCLEKWDLIPDGIDVLITHGPPIGHGDHCYSEERAGCVELLHTIQHRVKPKYHIFGHIHEGYGTTTDGFTKYINASTCTFRYKATNPAVIFDIPLPEGYTKDEFLSTVDTAERPMETDHESSENHLIGAVGP